MVCIPAGTYLYECKGMYSQHAERAGLSATATASVGESIQGTQASRIMQMRIRMHTQYGGCKGRGRRGKTSAL